jgi:hypothetical protein
MPKIFFFYGIVIYMYLNDHFPAHFHAQYGEFNAKINIENLGLLDGYLPPKAFSLVVEWGMLHQNEWKENWKRCLERSLFKLLHPWNNSKKTGKLVW